MKSSVLASHLITHKHHFFKLAGAFGAAYLVHKIFNYFHDKYMYHLKVAEGVDVLNVNRLLTFGISKEHCNLHRNKEFNCGNLDCNYGRLSYVLDFVNNAEESVDVCIYIITAQLFGDAFINAFKRGLKVRVIADSDMSFSAQSYVNIFRAHDIPIRQRMSPYIMHHKFIIVDNKILINGSMNFTMTGVFCNWENVMISSQLQLVQQFRIAFDTLWDDFAVHDNLADFKKVLPNSQKMKDHERKVIDA